MKSKNSICRRCHRVSATNRARYCALHDKEIRTMEKPRVAPPKGAEPITLQRIEQVNREKP